LEKDLRTDAICWYILTVFLDENLPLDKALLKKLFPNYHNYNSLLALILRYKKDYQFKYFENNCLQTLELQKQKYYWEPGTHCDFTRINDDNYKLILCAHLHTLKEESDISSGGFNLYIGTGKSNDEVIAHSPLYEYVDTELPWVYLFNKGGFIRTHDSI